jgi:AraC-like DNA-binding protein
MPISQDGGSGSIGGSRNPPTLTVGVVVRAWSDRSVIGQQLAYAALVRYLDAADAFGGKASRGADVVVTDAESLRDGIGRWRSNGVASRQFPVPVVVYDRADRLATDALPALMVSGLRIEFAVRPDEPLLPAIRQAMAGSQPTGAVPVILRRLLPLAPVPLRAFVAIAVLKATSGRGVDQLARWSQLSPRTLERRLVRAGWATAHVVLQTVRALDAVWLMAEHRWPARRIQRFRQFAHASSITRLMQRHLGLTPAVIREGAGFETALEHACDVLAHRGARPHRA